MEILNQINQANQIWEVLPNLNIQQLEKAIAAAVSAYYSGNPIISDRYYDILIDKLKNRDPHNALLSTVGSAIGAKVKLPYWMGSMDKIKTEESVLLSWQNEYLGPYVISDKLDGISGLLVSKNGLTMYTRGNGTYGKNITHMIPLLGLDKLKLPNNIAVRGELIMKNETFKKYSKEMVDARSLVAGVANSSPGKVNQTYVKDIDFVAYEIITDKIKPSDQFKQLKKLKFKTSSYHISKTLSIDELLNEYETRRKESPYELDGLIVIDDNVHKRNTEGNPPYAFAYKGPSETANVKVVEVIWTPSMYGVLIPRVRFEPIVLSNATIEYASGFNARFIVDSGIGPGAIITIVRSGGVIPDILDTVKRVSPSLPKEEYEWDENDTHFILKNPGDNTTVLIKSLTKFIRVIGAENISEGIITKLVKAGYFTIQNIIDLSVKDLEKIPGFKTRLATKTWDAIHGALERLDILTLMIASNQFGKGFAVKRIKKIMDTYPNIVAEFDPKDLNKWRVKISSIEGFGMITADMFLDGLTKFQEFYRTITIKAKPHNVQAIGDKLKGEVIVFTGFRDNALADKIIKAGGRITSSANSKTTVVIHKGVASASYIYAMQNNIPLLTADEFTAVYLS